MVVGYHHFRKHPYRDILYCFQKKNRANSKPPTCSVWSSSPTSFSRWRSSQHPWRVTSRSRYSATFFGVFFGLRGDGPLEPTQATSTVVWYLKMASPLVSCRYIRLMDTASLKWLTSCFAILLILKLFRNSKGLFRDMPWIVNHQTATHNHWVHRGRSNKTHFMLLPLLS